LFEKISSKNKTKYFPASIEQAVSQFRNKSNVVLHLNGFINNITESNLNNFFKLTSLSYLTETIKNSSWYEQLKTDINVSDVILFIGFSLENDLDIKRLFFSDSSIKAKTIFIISEKESELVISKLSRYGATLSCGILGLLHIFDSIPAITKSKEIDMPFLCFKEIISSNEITEKITDEDVFKLLFYGNINDEFLNISSIANDNRYVIRRNKINNIIDSIGKHHIPLVHSDLGNGKTILLYELGKELSRNGYRVFLFSKPMQTFNEELDKLTKEKGKMVILIDRYFKYFSSVKKMFKLLGCIDICFVLSERSSIVDYSFYELNELMEDDIDEFDINRLEGQDVDGFIELLNCYHFWGSRSDLSPEGKTELFISKYKKQIRLFLIDLLKSDDIKRRIQSLIENFKSDEKSYRFFILLIINDIINNNANSDIDDILSLLNYDFDISYMKYNIDYKDLLDISTGRILLKSSILSQTLIESLENDDTLVTTIILSMKNAAREQTTFAKSYIRDITLFSNLESIFRNKSLHRRNIVKVYEVAKGLDICKSNPYFWVQYAIAMITLNELDLAETYIENAYTYAKQRGSFDPFQIDNQYSRLLMERCTNSRMKDHFRILTRVQELITSPKAISDQRYYPYRVAMKYFDYYKLYFGELDLGQKYQFINYCEKMYTYAKQTLAITISDRSHKKIEDFLRTITIVIQKEDPKFFA
jgi:hypothetical protein